uniref:Uncharacterized protein n=1 Tax=Sphaerodactylus townsendi TaxID=933632 RepID=A0ACB8EPI6_9SAUR
MPITEASVYTMKRRWESGLRNAGARLKACLKLAKYAALFGFKCIGSGSRKKAESPAAGIYRDAKRMKVQEQDTQQARAGGTSPGEILYRARRLCVSCCKMGHVQRELGLVLSTIHCPNWANPSPPYFRSP